MILIIFAPFNMGSINTIIKKLFFKFGFALNKTKRKGKFIELTTTKRYSPQNITLLGKPFLVTDGFSFFHSFQEIFEDGIYSFNAEKKNPIIIDCGSNIGTSIYYFKSLYPDAIITGIEADPSIFSVLKQNIDNSRFQNIDIINKALWNTRTTLDFSHEGADAGRLNDVEKLNDSSIFVETILLSEILQEHSQIDMLKIDIEGAEVIVLEEIKSQLKKVKNLFIEFHSFDNRKQDLSTLLKILEESNFRYFIQTQYCPEQPMKNVVSQLNMDLQLNIFAIPETH
jgi:FkbM family methyltransferase